MSEADRRLRANAVGLSDGTARKQLLDSPPFNLHIIDSHSPQRKMPVFIHFGRESL